MTARVRWGLMAGVVGLLVNTLASLIFAFFGPIVSFGIGIVAGFIVTKREPAETKVEGTQDGAITGLIAGSIILLGNLVGAVSNLVYAQSGRYEAIFGPLPDLSSPEQQTNYWLVGIGVGLLFGLIDALACVLGGALIVYIRSPRDSSPLQES